MFVLCLLVFDSIRILKRGRIRFFYAVPLVLREKSKRGQIDGRTISTGLFHLVCNLIPSRSIQNDVLGRNNHKCGNHSLRTPCTHPLRRPKDKAHRFPRAFSSILDIRWCGTQRIRIHIVRIIFIFSCSLRPCDKQGTLPQTLLGKCQHSFRPWQR